MQPQSTALHSPIPWDRESFWGMKGSSLDVRFGLEYLLGLLLQGKRWQFVFAHFCRKYSHIPRVEQMEVLHHLHAMEEKLIYESFGFARAYAKQQT